LLAFHNFKTILFRTADISSKAARLVLAKSLGETEFKEYQAESSLSQIINDLFLEVVLPNMLDQNCWNKHGRRGIENAIADIIISQIVR
jgi:hypothetical protein